MAITYPATYAIDAPPEIDRWRPFVQWILAIPHAIIQYFLQIVLQVVSVISWFAILFTGKMPEGLARFSAMALRYQYRLMSYSGFLHADYPPFEFPTTFEDPGGQPVRVDYEVALEDRNRLTVGLRFIWIIPAALFAMVVFLAAYVVWFIAIFAVLFTGRWPDGMRSFVIRALGVVVRLSAYAALLTDEYPPFELD